MEVMRRIMPRTISAIDFQARRAAGKCFRCNVDRKSGHRCPAEANNEDDEHDGKNVTKIAIKLRERGINEPPQPYVSSTAIVAICGDNFVLMVADSMVCNHNGVAFLLHEQKLVSIARSVVVSGAGSSVLIEHAMDFIREDWVIEQIENATSMHEAAEIIAQVFNAGFADLNLNPLEGIMVEFMVAGFSGQTKETLLIQQHPVTLQFSVNEPTDPRVCCIGSDTNLVMAYMQRHPLPPQCTMNEAKDYFVECLSSVFDRSNTSGGDIRIRSITGPGAEDDGDEEMYTKQVRDGVEAYYLDE